MRQDLSRFTEAQRRDYPTALREIRGGRKQSHWMWYIFPQVRGLGRSTTAQHYAISSREEAIAFLSDPYLGGNLREISAALLALDENNPVRIFGYTDAMKLRSCMTLFASVSEDGSVFRRVLDRYCRGEQDDKTLEILSSWDAPRSNEADRKNRKHGTDTAQNGLRLSREKTLRRLAERTIRCDDGNIGELRARFSQGLHFVVGDVHGEVDTLKKLMDKIRFDPALDHVYFVGDYNGGGNVRALIGYLAQYYQPGDAPGFHLIRGNHERELGPIYPLRNLPDIMVLRGKNLNFYLVHAGMVSSAFDLINSDMETQPDRKVFAYRLDDNTCCCDGPLRQLNWSRHGLYSQTSRQHIWPDEARLAAHSACIIHGHSPYCYFKKPDRYTYGEDNLFWEKQHVWFCQELRSFNIDSHVKGKSVNEESYRGLSCICLEVYDALAAERNGQLTTELLRTAENGIFSVDWEWAPWTGTYGPPDAILNAAPRMKTIGLDGDGLPVLRDRVQDGPPVRRDPVPDSLPVTPRPYRVPPPAPEERENPETKTIRWERSVTMGTFVLKNLKNGCMNGYKAHLQGFPDDAPPELRGVYRMICPHIMSERMDPACKAGAILSLVSVGGGLVSIAAEGCSCSDASFGGFDTAGGTKNPVLAALRPLAERYFTDASFVGKALSALSEREETAAVRDLDAYRSLVDDLLFKRKIADGREKAQLSLLRMMMVFLSVPIVGQGDPLPPAEAWDARGWLKEWLPVWDSRVRARQHAVRAAYYMDHVRITELGRYISQSGKEVEIPWDARRMLENSDMYSTECTPEPPECLLDTAVEVWNMDCLDAAKRLQEESGGLTAVLNLANRRNPGGGVFTGSGAQEESCFLRSNYFAALYPFADYANDYDLPRAKEQYPMDRDFGGVWSGGVTVFRGRELEGYPLLDAPWKTNFIAVAAMNRPRTVMDAGQERLHPDCVPGTLNKIRTVMNIAADHGVNNLVLGALGCGAFRNPPRHIAELFAQVLNEPPYRGRFSRVVFAITNGSLCDVFADVFHCRVLRED